MSATNTNSAGTDERETPYVVYRGISTPFALMWMAIALVLGVIGTLGIQLMVRPLPQALVAQTGPGVFLTAPTTCADDQIYQATVNGGEAKAVVNGKLVTGDLVVTATAKFSESGMTDTVIVEAKARDAREA